MRVRISTAALLLLWSLSLAAAEPVHMGIATGSPTGTYFQIGNDLSRLVSRDQIQLDVQESRGSVENLVTLWDRRSIQLAIAQSDVLFFMAELGDDKTRDIISDIRVAMPLYTEETHLLASEGITEFADLEGKRVGIGLPGSGSGMSAEIFFELTGVVPAVISRAPLEEALAALRTGDLDAIMVIAGSPMRLLAEGVAPEDGLHLVSMGDVPSLAGVYGKPVVIPAGTYHWQTEAVETVGVVAALMTIDYPPEDEACENVRRVTAAIGDHFDWLKTEGHEKWADVDLSYPVTEAVRSGCSALFD